MLGMTEPNVLWILMDFHLMLQVYAERWPGRTNANARRVAASEHRDAKSLTDEFVANVTSKTQPMLQHAAGGLVHVGILDRIRFPNSLQVRM